MLKITLVPTPIGNLEDITMRALHVLKTANLIAAEDTRTSGKLLKHYEIKTPQISLHQHNEHKKIPQLLDQVEQASMHLAVITDAGTPGISDPGFLLVREALQRQIKVETLPGATAFVPALVSSGLPSDRFVFEGFLPVKKGRASRIESLLEEKRTMIFYESPHRILKTLTQFIATFGPERAVCVAKEISKLHETYWRGSLSEVLAQLKERNLKGEWVIVLGGKQDS